MLATRDAADRGAVTVEAAMVLCALTLVLGLVLAGAMTITGQLRCADAAREAARLIARGQRPLADQAVVEIAPPGARLSIESDGTAVTAKVDVDPAGGLLPGVHLHAEAYAALEPGVADASG